MEREENKRGGQVMRRGEKKSREEKRRKERRGKERTKDKRQENIKEEKRIEKIRTGEIGEIGEKRSYANILIWDLGDGEMKLFTFLIL